MDSRPDLDSPEQIRVFVDAFYARVLADPLLAPIFIDVAGIDLPTHIPIICAYWEKLLLGGDGYHRHTMKIHRALHAKRRLERPAFERWLKLFHAALDAQFEGPLAERAKSVASRIAHNMEAVL
ncbi:MAG: group III truncated hemoglobin [Pseudomonadales bacterium]|nr:group III truncated hemoglobin [Pseudomonadales bacterium]